MRWHPIENLSEDWTVLADAELAGIGDAWQKEWARLQEQGRVEDFIARLNRSWSIETGILERIYSLDRGVTTILVAQGFSAALVPHGASDLPPDQLVGILQDHQQAIDMLWDVVANNRPLSVAFVRQLHSMMTLHQQTVTGLDSLGQVIEVPLVRGEWKLLPNNPTRPDGTIHEYCPPVHVGSEMDRLIAWHEEHREAGVPPDVEAAWLHHRFAQIHPFQDGNGRVARALASLILIQGGLLPLNVTRDDRATYIEALEIADRGDLAPLVRLFAGLLKPLLLRALSQGAEQSREPAVEGTSRANILSDAAERLRARVAPELHRTQAVLGMAQELRKLARAALEQAARDVTDAFGDLGRQVEPRVLENTDQSDYWYQWEIGQVAGQFDYYADPSRPRLWTRLTFHQGPHIVVSFHFVGVRPSMVMAATAFFTVRENVGGEGKTSQNRVQRLCNRPFSFTDETSLSAVASDYAEWLDTAVVLGLEAWRRTL